MTTLLLLLLIGASCCFALAAFVPVRSERPNLIALGLLLFALVPTIQMLVRMG